MEYLLLFLMSKYYFNLKYYKHQYCSIILIILFDLLKDLAKSIITNDLLLFFILFPQIIYDLFDSLIIGFIKILMEFKYLSPYHICSTFGFIKGLITIIFYFIVTYTPCNNKLCKLEYNNEKYFDNIYSAFDNLTLNEIFLFIYIIFQSGFCNILIYTIINDFTICHLFLFYQVLEFEDNLIEIMIIDSEYTILEICFLIISSIFEIFIVLIFLEIIELKFCELSYYTKRNIKERALTESNLSTEIITLPEEDDMIDEQIE